MVDASAASLLHMSRLIPFLVVISSLNDHLVVFWRWSKWEMQNKNTDLNAK